MSIKSDHWIRRMAEQHGLIEPFEPGQVRTNEGGRIISYGTSSYGYDVRCAREFKIFTNINSTIVDPKDFDQKNFVDVAADVCIIPPNSFALARTVEYFRIPRNVLTVCLGKCVTGDTRVVDADTGAYVPITEMRFGRSTLAMENWRLRSAKVSGFMEQGRREVFELRTRAGLRIRATASHPFRMLAGWRALEHLRAGDRIAAAREVPVFGKTPIPDWEATLLGLMIGAGRSELPGSCPTYASADPVVVALLKKAAAESGLGKMTCDGRHGYRLVNHGGGGGVPARDRTHEWLKRHRLDVAASEKFVPQSIFTAPKESVRLFLRALFSGDGAVFCNDAGCCVEYHCSARRLLEDVHHLLLRFGVFSQIREACGIQITDAEQIERFARQVGFPAGSIKQQRLESELLPMIAMQPRCTGGGDRRPTGPWSLLGASDGAAGRGLDRLSPRPRVPSMPHGAALAIATLGSGGEYAAPAQGPVWDTVLSVESVGVQEVYDISVPGPRNFLANDLVVHNSTYARCFSGDTMVALVDGQSASLEEMARGADAGRSYHGYSVGTDGLIAPATLQYPRYIGRDALIEVTLDNGQRIRATPDHKFWRRDGGKVATGQLRAGDALLPLYRQRSSGRRTVYQPMETAFRLERAPAAASMRPTRPLRAVGGPLYLNHQVMSVRELPGVHDVYCLSVPEAGNFALDAGVFVDNCGIIVNVTPLEPEWEGHVTLEFSNTTPLPAKIYANEGVAQMLFFESDEVCATSYKDRGGKYQGQRGVTLPKA